ncbi:MAG TPA: 16S rRNA (uracil(1498)-N(3))-methyltransferase [Pyrinomonadaceae bacterium]|jgi:16S rRNA (uracil1498-N3)-methyltransferase
MVRRRFYAPPVGFAPDGLTVTLAADETRHLRDVLRLKRGDEVFVFDGEGREYACVIDHVDGSAATLHVSEEVAPARPESPLRLTLALALLKGEKFDLVVQKATELGVGRIVPVLTKLSDVRPRDEQDAARRTTRLRRIALEASKQSGRARVPLIDAPVAFQSLIESASTEVEEWRLMFAERGGRSLVETINQASRDEHEALTALVGSEGGWTDEEIAEAHKAGWSIITLGGRTLRAETAAITVAALLQHMMGDLR